MKYSLLLAHEYVVFHLCQSQDLKFIPYEP